MRLKVNKKLRIVVLVHADLVPPSTLDGHSAEEIQLWKTEYDVTSTLRDLGHHVYPAGLRSELADLRRALEENKPHITFNLMEEFDGYPLYDQHVVSYLELSKQKYTGCNPRGMMLSRDKGLTKRILAHHRILVPRFAVFPIHRKVHRPARLTFPLLVKSLTDEGSVAIAQASIVHDDQRLAERVEFVHRQTGRPAIGEEYVEGREIYVSVIGNRRLQAYTPWEMVLENLPEGSANIATGKVKWDPKYQKKVGLVTRAAGLTIDLEKRLHKLSKRIYRILGLSGYARLDYRLTEDGRIYLLEANPNPQIARNEDFADSAAYRGVTYEALLQRIISLGLSYDAVELGAHQE